METHMKKHLYVPIEIKCREYPAKGELALNADRKGFVSVKGLYNPFGAAPSLQAPARRSMANTSPRSSTV
jgi:hypothetical protein